jgi:hypothetical protein
MYFVTDKVWLCAACDVTSACHSARRVDPRCPIGRSTIPNEIHLAKCFLTRFDHHELPTGTLGI